MFNPISQIMGQTVLVNNFINKLLDTKVVYILLDNLFSHLQHQLMVNYFVILLHIYSQTQKTINTL